MSVRKPPCTPQGHSFSEIVQVQVDDRLSLNQVPLSSLGIRSEIIIIDWPMMAMAGGQDCLAQGFAYYRECNGNFPRLYSPISCS